MTAPVYEDTDMVEGVTLSELKSWVEKEKENAAAGKETSPLENVVVHFAKTAVALWKARDAARETAALQDAAAQKASILMGRMELLCEAALTATHEIPLTPGVREAMVPYSWWRPLERAAGKYREAKGE